MLFLIMTVKFLALPNSDEFETNTSCSTGHQAWTSHMRRPGEKVLLTQRPVLMPLPTLKISPLVQLASTWQLKLKIVSLSKANTLTAHKGNCYCYYKKILPQTRRVDASGSRISD